MAVAITTVPRPYILKCDAELPESEQTRFFIRPLTAREYAQVQDSVKFGSGKKVKIDGREVVLPENLNQLILLKLSHGLTGWENLLNHSGLLIDWETGKPEMNISLLRPEWRIELANAIDDLTELSEGERKN